MSEPTENDVLEAWIYAKARGVQEYSDPLKIFCLGFELGHKHYKTELELAKHKLALCRGYFQVARDHIHGLEEKYEVHESARLFHK